MADLHDQLGCFGYFGFGSGYQIAKFGPSDDTAETYCSSRCPKGQRCWTRHQQRVRGLFPEIAALADEIAKAHKGQDYIAEFRRQTEQGTGDGSFVEPYLGVNAGNIKDGAAVAATGKPERERGAGTLTWPLEPLSEDD